MLNKEKLPIIIPYLIIIILIIIIVYDKIYINKISNEINNNCEKLVKKECEICEKPTICPVFDKDKDLQLFLSTYNESLNGYKKGGLSGNYINSDAGAEYKLTLNYNGDYIFFIPLEEGDAEIKGNYFYFEKEKKIVLYSQPFKSYSGYSGDWRWRREFTIENNNLIFNEELVPYEYFNSMMPDMINDKAIFIKK